MARILSLDELRDHASHLQSEGASVAFLFGAGLSYYSGSPLFGELMDSCIAALHHGDPDLKVLADRLQGSADYSRLAPEALFNLLFEAMGPTGLDPVRVFALGHATFPHYCAVQAAGLLKSPILTTNFDLLIEQAARLSRFGNPPVIHLHGRVDQLRTIRVTMNRVWSGNMPAIRRMTRDSLPNRHVFVGGYRGLDSDVFPLLEGATELIWLKRAAIGGDFYDENPRLKKYESKLTFCEADIQDSLEAVLVGLGGLPAGPRTSARAVLDWQRPIRKWGATAAREDRYAVIGKLLALAGDLEGATSCFEALYTSAASLSERGVALAGLVSIVGPRKADWAAVEKYASEYDALALRPGVRRKVFGPSVVLNARETAHLAGTTCDLRRYWRSMLALQAGSMRRKVSRMGWLLNQSARGRIERGHFSRAQLAIFGASVAFRLTRDFSGSLVLAWNEQGMLKLQGTYTSARRLDDLLDSPDMRFVDDLFLFWIHWLEADCHRLQGRFEESRSGIQRIDPSGLHPVHRVYRNLQILASTRGAGTLSGSDAAGLLAQIDADCTKLASMGPGLGAKVLFERALSDVAATASDPSFVVRLNELRQRAEAARDRANADLLDLLRLRVLGDLGGVEALRLLDSPVRTIRVHALLAIGNATLGRQAYERRRSRELQYCRLHNMGIEQGLLIDGVAPSAVAIQVPH